MACAGAIAAAETDPYRGIVSLSLQTVRTDSAYSGDNAVVLPDSSSEAWVSLLEVDYAISDRWSFALALPYVYKRFTGFPPHNPALLENRPSGAQFIDDGDFHGGLQDWRAELSYYLTGSRWELEPFARVELPSRDYPHFGSAAIGQNLWRAALGADFDHQLAFSNFFYGVGYSYTFVEETLGISVDYHRLSYRAGYFLTPRWSVELFGEARRSKGRDPSDFECGAFRPDGSCIRPRFDDVWYQHDRLLRHEYATLGFESTFELTDADSVSLSAWKMVWGRSINRLSLAVSLTLSRRF